MTTPTDTEKLAQALRKWRSEMPQAWYGNKLLDEAAAALEAHESRAQPASVADVKNTAEQLCRIYFEIAADCIGEDEVRRRRDERIAMLAAAAPQPAKERSVCNRDCDCVGECKAGVE